MTDPQQYGGQQQYGGPPPQYGGPQQQPYGAPPPQGTPPPPGAYGQPPMQAPMQAPKRNMGRRRIIALVVLVLVVGGIGIAAYSSSKSSPDAAKVGDCVSKTGTDSVKKVGCADASATYKVVGKVEHKTQVDLSLNSSTICKPFPSAQSAYWRGEVGKEGYILCLAPVK